jgi:hypothetical protein
LGDASEQRDFVVISRLAIFKIFLAACRSIYSEVKPRVRSTDAAQATQIEQSLQDLKVLSAMCIPRGQADINTRRKADMLGAEAQNRATAIAGQVAQIAAKLNIKIEE